jgi:diguanylate cyclase (GGDEF)-like protein
MGVGASMSVSLLPRGELWGLIACHNTTARLLSFEVQEICRHIGQILSQQIRTREESKAYRAERDLAAAREKVMLALSNADDPGALLLRLCPDIQSIVPSHGLAVCRKGSIGTAGHVPTKTHVRQLVAWLDQRLWDVDFFATDCLSKEYPAAKAFSRRTSGLLSIVLRGSDPVTVIWFRAEQVEEINWAGNPHEPGALDARLGSIHPRKSFATWQQTVSEHSQPWETVEVDSASAFALRATFVLQQKTVRELNHLLSEANERLEALASTDGLTDIANRRAFDEYLQKEWRRSGRPPYSSLAIIILDLDFFKQYNDQYGHVMGDACLQRVAKILHVKRRAADLAARIGGEEFAIVLPNTDIQGAVAVAETMRKQIEDLQLEHTGSSMGIVTASFGVAVAVNDSIGKMQNLLHSADLALYRAKENGRNQVAST